MRTVRQMIDEGDIEEQNFSVKIDGFTVDHIRGTWDFGVITDQSVNQRVKIGRAYLYDESSDIHIPLQGTSLKDVTFKGE